MAAAPWNREMDGQTDGSLYSKMPPLRRGDNKAIIGHMNCIKTGELMFIIGGC